jgi:hypothetical protein
MMRQGGKERWRPRATFSSPHVPWALPAGAPEPCGRAAPAGRAAGACRWPPPTRRLAKRLREGKICLPSARAAAWLLSGCAVSAFLCAQTSPLGACSICLELVRVCLGAEKRPAAGLHLCSQSWPPVPWQLEGLAPR